MGYSYENKFSEVSQWLVDVAMGRKYADLVIQKARLVNVHTAEILPNVDVAVACGRITFMGDAAHTIGPDTAVIDASGMTLVPGFLDGHIHVESSMVNVSGFAQAVLPHGTTAILRCKGFGICQRFWFFSRSGCSTVAHDSHNLWPA